MAQPNNDTVPSNTDVAQLSFERAIDELESIVKRLEDGKVPLEESVAIYERGEALKRRCEELLRLAEARVEKITLDAAGRPTGSEPLDVECSRSRGAIASEFCLTRGRGGKGASAPCPPVAKRRSQNRVGFAALRPPYEQQTKKEGRTPTDAVSHDAVRARTAARPAGRARLSAFHRGSCRWASRPAGATSGQASWDEAGRLIL